MVSRLATKMTSIVHGLCKFGDQMKKVLDFAVRFENMYREKSAAVYILDIVKNVISSESLTGMSGLICYRYIAVAEAMLKKDIALVLLKSLHRARGGSKSLSTSHVEVVTYSYVN